MDVFQELFHPRGLIANRANFHKITDGSWRSELRHDVTRGLGVHHHDVSTITTQFRGVFKTDKVLQQRFMDLVRK